jgi:hypothetical protein
MSGNKLNLLSQESLLNFTQNKNYSNDYWKIVMDETLNTRKNLNDKINSFINERFWIEISVKIAVAITLGIGLSFGVSPALLFGAAFTLALSSFIYSMINPAKYEVDLNPAEEAQNEELSAERLQWISGAKMNDYDNKENVIIRNMLRIGLFLVSSFAGFASVISGADLLLTLGSVLCSSFFFLRQIDGPAPYIENNQRKLN